MHRTLYKTWLVLGSDLIHENRGAFLQGPLEESTPVLVNKVAPKYQPGLVQCAVHYKADYYL